MLWSNSWRIQKLDLGELTKHEKETSVPLAHVYIDRNGKKRSTGKKGVLKDSQILVGFIYCYTRIHTYVTHMYICILVRVDKKTFIVPMSVNVNLLSIPRTYSRAFGHRVASLLPDISFGVWGLRAPDGGATGPKS